MVDFFLICFIPWKAAATGYSAMYDQIVSDIIEFLKNKLLNKICIEYSKYSMQRGYADQIEGFICDSVKQLNYDSSPFAMASSKRSIEDFSWSNGLCTIFFDIKTTNVDDKFNMPNLISIIIVNF